MKLEEKVEIVKGLKDKFSKARIVIVTDYKGLNVATMTSLRKKLREAGVEYEVVKNTLLTKASEDTTVSVIKDMFKGTTAVALGYTDPVAPAKVLTAFGKDNDKFQIRGGVLDGRALNFALLKSLSTLPSREILLSQMLSAMNGMSSGLVRTLAAIPQSLLNVLMSIKAKKEKESTS